MKELLRFRFATFSCELFAQIQQLTAYNFLMQNFIAGAASGIIARTLTSPLDVVKILCQIGAPETTHGLFRSFVNVYRSSGLKGFWKGNLIACLRLVPYNGLLFSFYHKLKVMWCEPSTGQLSSPKSFTAGALAGIGSSLLLYPLGTRAL